MTVFVVISAIILVIIIVNILLQFFRAVRLPKQSIIAFTGTLGSGKTYLAVKHAIRAYNKQRFHHKIYKALAFLPFRNKLLKDWKYEASFYSNIPVQIDKETISTPLKKEDLLERSRLPQKCVVLIDEIGQLASQWEFDNPLVMEQLGTFIRFFRHWLDGKMFVTDQVADNIVKQIRSRLGMIYNLHDFHRYGGIMPFFKVTAIPLILIEDATNAVESFNGEDYEDTFFFGFLSYSKSGKHKKYQTRCFKPIYTDVALRTIEHFDDSLYTRYLMDISVSQKVKKEYLSDKEKYKSYLYDDIPKGVSIQNTSPLAVKTAVEANSNEILNMLDNFQSMSATSTNLGEAVAPEKTNGNIDSDDCSLKTDIPFNSNNDS